MRIVKLLPLSKIYTKSCVQLFKISEKDEIDYMTQEEYLQLKKEYKIRLVLVIVLFVLFSILSILLIINLNRFIPLGATAMSTVVPFNHFLLVPLWEEKKAIEAEHPEWKDLSTSGARVPSTEASKRNIAAIGSIIALFFSFALLYRPAKVYQKVPTLEELKNLPKIENKGIPKLDDKKIPKIKRDSEE